MTDDKHGPASETQPVRPADGTPIDVPPPSPPPATEPVQPTRRGLRERLAGTGGAGVLVASIVAALVLGGLGGAAIHAAVDDPHHGDRGGFSRVEHPRGPHDGERGGPGGPGRMPGLLPPPTVPEG